MSEEREERGSDIADRMSKRFEDEKPETEADTSDADTEPSGTTDDTSKTRNPSASAYDALTGNVRNDREQKAVFLPDPQRRELETQFKRLSYEYELEFDRDLELNAHYYPVVMEFGLDAVTEMDAETLDEALQAIDERY